MKLIRSARRRSGFTLIEILVVVAIIAVLAALLIPALQAAREAARRSSCQNNLKQLTLALHNYHMSFDCFPPGCIDVQGPIASQRMGYHTGWLLQVLPYMEQRALHSGHDFKQSVYAPINSAAWSCQIPGLHCQSDGKAELINGMATTSYAGSHHGSEAAIDADNNGLLYLNSSVRPVMITDGSSNTFLVGEKLRAGDQQAWPAGTRTSLRNASGLNVGRMTPAPPNMGGPLFVGGFSSQHPGGVQFAMSDGAVRFISDAISTAVLQRLGNRHDGELNGEF